MDPRVARSREKIRTAVLDELAEVGYGALTVEGVAARACVGKTTIYRHWDSLPALVHDAIRSTRPGHDVAPTGELRADLLAFLDHLVAVMTTGESARFLTTLVAAAELDEEMASLHADFVTARRRPLVAMLREAIERGELPEDLDVEVAIDLLTGPLFLRRLVSRQPVDRAFAEKVVDTLLPRLGSLCP